MCVDGRFSKIRSHIYIYIYIYIYILLSTIVLNIRDWSEIIWLPEISRFKINLAIGFIRKKPAGIHWLVIMMLYLG